MSSVVSGLSYTAFSARDCHSRNIIPSGCGWAIAQKTTNWTNYQTEVQSKNTKNKHIHKKDEFNLFCFFKYTHFGIYETPINKIILYCKWYVG